MTSFHAMCGAVGGLLAFSTLGVHAQSFYQVVEIPPPLTGALSQSIPYDINSKNEVVGEADMADGHRRAFLYSGGVFTDLGAFEGGVYSQAFGINDSSQVVGTADKANFDQHAFLYSKGVMKDLGTLGGPESIAKEINNAGVIVGEADVPLVPGNFQTHQAFIYKAGKMSSLGTLGGLYSSAFSINNAGKVVGSSTTTPGSGVATGFYYPGTGTIKSIGYLEGGNTSYTVSISTNGTVLGNANRGGMNSFAIAYASNVMADLYAQTSDIIRSTANQMNSSGKVVGTFARPGTGDHGFIAITGGQPVDLNTLIDPTEGWVVRSAWAINDAGVIAAYANKAGISFGHAVLLIPGDGPPVALTGHPADITTTTAAIDGQAIANGFDGQAWFQYGTTTSYSSKTATQTLAGSAPVQFEAALASLKPHTTYHFRIVAKNSKGTKYGGDNTFKTANSTTVANDDLFFVNSTKATSVNVLANDTDADHDALKNPYPFSEASSGLAKTSGANIVYTPGVNFVGTDTIKYFVTDSFGSAPFAFAYVMNSTFDGLTVRDGKDTGLVTVVMSGQGSFTAKVRLGTLTYSWTGKLDGDRRFTGAITPKGLPAATLHLEMVPENATISGTVNNGEEHLFSLANAFTVDKDEGNRKLTAYMPPPGGAELPAGYGYGTMSVAGNGAITLAGKAGDGTAYTVAARVRFDHSWNLMAGLTYPGKKLGYMVGGLNFDEQSGSDSAGTLRWVKPAIAGATYLPDAFDTTVDFKGAFYTPPLANAPVLTFTSPSMTLADGNIDEAIFHILSVSNKNAVTVTAPAADKLKVTITPSTGALGGSFVHPLKTKVSTPIYGVIYQKQNLGGRGVFVGTTNSGQVFFAP